MARESHISPPPPAFSDEYRAQFRPRIVPTAAFVGFELEMEFRSEPAMVMELGTLGAVIGWIILHIGALASAWGTRMASGSRIEPLIQLAFFAAMAAVGGAAWVCRQEEVGLWIPSAMTLVGMVITAVVDFRRTHEPLHTLYVAARS